jgi:hypothetical protein
VKLRALSAVLAVVTVLAAGASGTLAAAKQNSVAYEFRGALLATPAPGATSLSLDVRGGNHRALRLMVGQSDTQSFTVGSHTEYLRWSHGVPTVVSQSNLVAGDKLTIRIRAARGSSLAQVEATEANVVADRGPTPGHPARALWLFRGTLNAPAANGKLSIHVTDGNHLALRAMLGQSVNQTFSYDSHTIFVLWQGRVPSVISPGQLQAGDRIAIRIRAARGSSLAQVESTAANHVAEHEPAPQPES